MKKIKKLVSSALIGIVILAATGCSMVRTTPEGINNAVVAKIDSQKITRGEVDEAISQELENIIDQYGENYMKDYQVKAYVENLKNQVITQIKNDIIIEEKAVELNILPSEDEIAKQMEETKEEVKKSLDEQVDIIKEASGEEEFKKYLESIGKTEEELRTPDDITERTLRASVINQVVYDEITKDVTVSEEEIKEYYEQNKSSFQESPSRLHSAHILVETEEEAKTIKKQLDEGADFETLAKDKSLDIATKDNGGDLGWINYGDIQQGMVFMAAAKEMSAGEISEPIQEDDGFHIIKLIEKEEYEPKAYDEVKEQIEDTLESNKKSSLWSEEVTKWNEEVEVKIYEDKLY